MENKIEMKKKFDETPNLREESEIPAIRVMFLDEIREWCLNTANLGFPNIARSNNWIQRTIWSLLLLGLSIYCFTTIMQAVFTYLEYEVNINYDVITEAPTDFPAVTICNLNPFDFYNDDSTTIDLLNQILVENNITLDIHLDSYASAMKKVSTAHTALRASVGSSLKLTFPQMKSLGFQIEKMLISCSFNQIPCSAANFTWFRDFHYGNCFTFNALFDDKNNSLNVIRTSKSGINNGLQLEMFLGLSDVDNFFAIQNGIYVVVHNRSSFPIMRYQGIYAAAGIATNIGVTKTFFKKLDHPYSDCRSDVKTIQPSDSNIFVEAVNITTYSQQMCFEVCLQHKFILPICGCKDPTIPQSNVFDLRLFCHSQSQFDCVDAQRDYFNSNQLSSMCDQFCPLECESQKFTFTTNFADYPSDYYLNLLQTVPSFVVNTQTPHKYVYDSDANIFVPRINTSNVTTSSLKDSMLILNVYYEDLRVTVIEEQPSLSVDTMFGIVGGQLGLFLGTSCLSFIEFFELIICLAINAVKYAANYGINKGSRVQTQ